MGGFLRSWKGRGRRGIEETVSDNMPKLMVMGTGWGGPGVSDLDFNYLTALVLKFNNRWERLSQVDFHFHMGNSETH